jgi:hypothetical protein
MICLWLKHRVQMMNVAHVVHVAMTVVAVQVLTVPHRAALVVLSAPTVRLPMAATNPSKPLVSTPTNPPLSAYAKSPRQLQQLTVKENNYVATCSSQVPQRAKGP